MSVSAGCVKVLILRGGGCIFIRNKDVGVAVGVGVGREHVLESCSVSRSLPHAHPSHKTHATCKVQIETNARFIFV